VYRVSSPSEQAAGSTGQDATAAGKLLLLQYTALQLTIQAAAKQVL
jgi:hypothetical protein